MLRAAASDIGSGNGEGSAGGGGGGSTDERLMVLLRVTAACLEGVVLSAPSHIEAQLCLNGLQVRLLWRCSPLHVCGCYSSRP